MKKIQQYVITLMILLSGTIVSCSEDSVPAPEGNQPDPSDYIKRIEATIPDFVESEKVNQKGTATITEATGLQLVWSVNDIIGIFPKDGSQVAFSMAKGAGSKNAVFEGGGWGIKASASYSAYYPLVNQSDLDKTKIPLIMDGQEQDGNGSYRHIGKTDYMIAIDAEADESRSVAFAFSHLVCSMHLKFKLPNAANVAKIMLMTNGSFITKANLDLTNGSVTATESSATQTLNLTNVSVANEEILDVYMNMQPVDLTDKTVYAVISGDNGVCYTATWTGKDYQAGSMYHISENATINPAFSSGLPLVVIDTPNGAEITSKIDWTEHASMLILNADGSTDYCNDALQIRGRGNTTWGFPKKPYALKLDSKAAILGMPKHKRWCLLANWMDRTLLRNDVSFQIAKQTGLAWTPRGEFVEVIMNGTHIGNYYLCEQIKVDKNRVNIAEMTPSDLAGDAITGGYLMELDVYFDEVNKFHSATANMPYMFKEPDEDGLQPEQFAWFENYINEMESKLYASDWLVNREYANYMDLASFVDWWFVYELAMNMEALHPKSSYIYKDRNGKLTAGPVWDFDYATYRPRVANSFVIKNAIYYGRLFSDPAFVSIVKERWALHKTKFEGIPDYIRSVAAKIKRSNEVDKAMWPMSANPEGSVNGDQDMSFDDAVERMISAYETKLAFLNTQISSM